MSDTRNKRDLNENLPGCSEEFVYCRFHLLSEHRRVNALALVMEVGQGDFLEKKCYVQVIRLLGQREVYRVHQTDIGTLVDLTNNIVSRIKKYHRLHPGEEKRKSGRPSELREVFPRIENFTDARNDADQAVTLDNLMEFVINQLHITPSRKTLWRFMRENGFCYKLAAPRDRLRLVRRENEIEAFYNNLAVDMNGLDPSLVFNVDEMGVEMFADRKDVMVFVRHEDVPPSGNLYAGVERSSRRCTLIACISLGGDALTPTILTKTRTVNSWLFERGYSVDKVKIMSTENSFVTADVFEIWLNEVFLPAVEEKRTKSEAGLVRRPCSPHFGWLFVSPERPVPRGPGRTPGDDEVSPLSHLSSDPTPRRWDFWAAQDHHPLQRQLHDQPPQHRQGGSGRG